MKNLIRLFAIFILVSGAVACDDNNNDNNGTYTITTFNATLNGANEVPANGSTATGTAVLLYNNSTNKFTITVSHNVVDPTAAHIHLVADRSIIFGFSNPASPIVYTSGVLNSTQEADLMANHYYVNVHSPTYTGGEISGVLIKGATATYNNGSGGY